MEKDFYPHREEAKRNKALIKRRCQDKAAELTDQLYLLEEALIALDKECHCHAASLQATVSAAISCTAE